MRSKLKIDCKLRRVIGRKLMYLFKYAALERQDAIIVLFRGFFFCLFLKYIFVCCQVLAKCGQPLHMEFYRTRHLYHHGKLFLCLFESLNPETDRVRKGP